MNTNNIALTHHITELNLNLYRRRSELEQQLNLQAVSLDNKVKKKMQKEISKINTVLINLADLKLNFLDPPNPDPKVEKEQKPSKKKNDKTELSYGISGMLK